jgi:hypothetical protein
MSADLLALTDWPTTKTLGLNRDAPTLSLVMEQTDYLVLIDYAR